MENQSIEVTPKKFYKSKGILMSAAIAPLAFIQGVQDFIAHYAWLQPIIVTLWGWLVRYMAKAPLAK
jgi:hypothetical protein